jgi:putative membrane protein
MMWNDGNWGVGSWLVMILMMLAFWGGLVVLVVWLVRNHRHDSAHATSRQGGLAGADSVLAERFARGEIDEDEFTHQRSVLHAADGS